MMERKITRKFIFFSAHEDIFHVKNWLKLYLKRAIRFKGECEGSFAERMLFQATFEIDLCFQYTSI